MRLSELLKGVHGARVSGDAGVEIRSLSHDSRRPAADSLFFALPGSATDGNRYVKEAAAKGAVAVLSELPPPPPPFAVARRLEPDVPVAWAQVPDALAAMSRVSAAFHGEPSSGLTVVGVTGTNGKTTTTYFLESVFLAAGLSPGVIGTVNARLRLRELEKPGNTTPLAPDIQRLLSRMLRGGATHAAMEVSSHALALRRADDVDFDAAVFTNLARDHLDYHKTLEGYFEAKARLFELLCRVSSSKKRRAAILNGDDPRSPGLGRALAGAEVLTFGMSGEADVRGAAVATTLDGTMFRLRRRGHGGGAEELLARLKLIGEHNVMNALAAAAVGFWLGLPARKVVEGLEALERVPGRLEPVKAGQPFHVFVDYAHTDSAVENVLSVLKRLPRRRIFTVMGCGGDRDRTKRGPMGAAACASSDMVFLTSDNPRSEDPLAILADIEEGVRNAGLQNYRILPDRREAVAAAVAAAGKGDIVLIAGKGHEAAQILKDRTVRFDDREEALAALARAGFK